ncbi:glycerophosphoryl diester phosphodiesterase [Nocardioides szechwanensis]|uniref:glycerophosphodiester phosphodiesterase n=1 Tax=Nocardioides szechwanensis TaxID=1005944 RepID=A0A1H0JW30_9ACTN|nr:glycerophosphodiester phosphodiesterase [Nocardioides szechwanensis]GEP35331.1 glycerophosphoryl diester phosphodiesterase [Nocardioides szechwanensis]SDO47800.1 glycerophosphoryl diester phosphodiesterase [Nocardioides szechwanensis]
MTSRTGVRRPALFLLVLTGLGGLVGPTLVAAPVAAEAGDSHAKHSQRRADPIVIGHRGASGYRPEHTLASYRLAIQLGADYVEPDLVSTKDGVLVARHENEISGTTDVADHAEFAARRTTKTIDGRPVTGWFTEDFTLAELKTLRAKERLPQVRPDNTRYDGRFEIPTLVEVLQLVRAESKRTGRTIGVYPETKHPTYFDSIGLSLEEPLVRTLDRFGLDRTRSKVIIQSFETANLRDLDTMTRVPLAQLVDASGAPYDLVAAGDPRTYRDLVTPAGLAEIAEYADGVGANKDLVLPRDPATGATTEPSRLVADAHRRGLVVHVWTVRDENQFMATNFRRGVNPIAKGDVHAEVLALLEAGVDGIFADHPDSAVDARDDWLD